MKNYVAGPPRLKEMEERIDQVAGTLKYVKGQDKLLAAIVAGDVAAVRALLEGGADAKAADDVGVTLVMRAAEVGNAETVRLLLKAGADPAARDRFGRNAADRARDGLAANVRKDYELILRLLTDE